MIEDESKFRKKLILGVIAILGMFTGIISLDYLNGSLTWPFYPGFIIGGLFGAAYSLYLSEVWDPQLLTMKRNSKETRISWKWGPPLGVLAGNIVARFWGGEVADLLSGLLFGWLYFLFSYFAIQVWRHRPR